MSNNYNNWCPEVYKSIFVDRHNDDKIVVAPCCQADSAIESVDNFDFETSPYLNKLRDQFDQGQRPSACHRCWKLEDLGQKSRRQSSIEFFNLPAPDNTVKLQSIDHSATWACNLACIMCYEKSSSFWAAEKNLSTVELENIGRRFQKKNNFISKLDLTNVIRLHFNGGEPMLNNDQMELLEELDKLGVLKNTVVSYNTNGTVYPSEKIIQYWNRCKLVKIFFSIDGTGPAFEYIRWPARWSQVSDNIVKMKQCLPSNVMFGFNCTISGYNLFEIVDVWNWFCENLETNREGDLSDFAWQIAYNYNIGELSDTVKQDAIKNLNQINTLAGIIQYINSTASSSQPPSWISKLENLDQQRNTSWKKSLNIGKYY